MGDFTGGWPENKTTFEYRHPIMYSILVVLLIAAPICMLLVPGMIIDERNRNAQQVQVEEETQ